jgi:hypothetical protein
VLNPRALRGRLTPMQPPGPSPTWGHTGCLPTSPPSCLKLGSRLALGLSSLDLTPPRNRPHPLRPLWVYSTAWIATTG